MDKVQDGAGAEMPAQDAALTALAALLEKIGGEAEDAFVRGAAGDEIFDDCRARAEVVVRAITGLRSVTLHGASAKVRAVRSGTAMALLPVELIDALGFDMASDVTRLRAPMESPAHA